MIITEVETVVQATGSNLTTESKAPWFYSDVCLIGQW